MFGLPADITSHLAPPPVIVYFQTEQDCSHGYGSEGVRVWLSEMFLNNSDFCFAQLLCDDQYFLGSNLLSSVVSSVCLYIFQNFCD